MKQSTSHRIRQYIFINPAARTEEDRRRSYIFNILVCGTVVLSSLSLISSTVSKFTRGTSYDTVPLIAMALITGFFVGLWYLARRGYYRYAAGIYVVAFFLIATYPLMRWGVILPQGILTYCLIIVITGVLLNARAAFIMTLVATLTLLLLERLSSIGALHFDTAWMDTTGGYNDIIVFGVTFALVAVVAWLSNQQIEQSLRRARESEKALRLERNLLEVRVRERTKELERAQVEKLEELNRFAEFGRISSTLLHELANPLTSAVLNLESIKGKRTSKLYDQLHESISYMEQYVTNARRQLRRESEVSTFAVAEEIRRVAGFMQPKARAMNVKLELNLDTSLQLNGDSVKFDQIISNLLGNAIDANETLLPEAIKAIRIGLAQHGKLLSISVRDYGIGISKKDLPHVFDAFYTTKLSDRGTGLGLTITRRSVEEDFGGTIAVTSSKRGGTCFTLKIPSA